MYIGDSDWTMRRWMKGGGGVFLNGKCNGYNWMKSPENPAW